MKTMTRRDFLRVSAGAGVGGSLLACGGDATDLQPFGNPKLTVRPFDPGLSAPAGESPLGLGGSRDGLLYVPATYDPSTPAPLLVALHGTPGDATLWAPFYAACEDRGMVMLAPESRGLAWDRIELGRFGPDVPFIDDALAFTFERCRIDPQRIALCGFSDGATYALSLGPSNGDIFSHIIAFSPGHTLASPPIVGRPRVFVSHGTGDAVLPVAGSRSDIVPFLQSLGYSVTYQEFAGGHIVPREIAQAAFDWFGA